MTETTYQIGEVAARVGLSQRSIRHYDDLGIVKPSARTAGGFRLYTQADVDRFLLIKPFKPLGIGLEEARTVTHSLALLDDPLAGEEDKATAREHLARIVRLVAERQSELEEAFAASKLTVAVLERVVGDAVPVAPGIAG